MQGLHPLEELYPGQVRELGSADHHLDGVEGEQLERLGGVVRAQDAVALVGQRRAQGAHVAGVGVHDEQQVGRDGVVHLGQHHPQPHQVLDVGRRERPAEEVSLHLVAPVVSQVGQLRGGFDALGDDVEFEAVRHADDSQRDGRLVGLGGDVADERHVDLQLVDREPAQVGQAGVPGAEVVDRDLHPVAAQALQRLDRLLGVLHQ